MKDDLKYNIDKVIGIISEDANDWKKYITKISWGESESKLNIRTMNLEKKIIGKGISLSDDESELMVNLLLAEGYGSINILEEELERRKSIKSSKRSDD